MTNRHSLCSSFALGLSLAACSSSNSASPTASSGTPQIAQSTLERTPAASVPTDALSSAVSANNAFAVDLFAHVLADPSNPGAGNVLTSPISASLALTMTYAGALGQTATEMAQALHIDASAGSAIFQGQDALTLALNGRAADALAYSKNLADPNAPPVADDYQLQVVNSIWGEKTYHWQAPFLDTLAQDYGTGVYQEDFENAPDPARLAINSWVSDQTNDKINDLLGPGAIDNTTRMVLVNAIHLKFPWQTAFDVTQSAMASFTRDDGTPVSTPFMNQTGSFDYVDDGQAQVISIPLRGQQESVLIAVPHVGVKLADYEATLSAGAPALGAVSSNALVSLSLPKMTFTSQSVSLSDALESMGMQQAFDKQAANLTGIAVPQQNETLYVSDVIQKATIAMQETGVEAAAATAVVVAGDAAVAVPPPTPIPMVVNRPYLLAIVDVPTGAVLMLGHIQDPTSTGSP
jgi:serpin B